MRVYLLAPGVFTPWRAESIMTAVPSRANAPASASELAQDAPGRGRLGEHLSAYVAGDGCTILGERNLVHILVHTWCTPRSKSVASGRNQQGGQSPVGPR
jgi:hypothetical protein